MLQAMFNGVSAIQANQEQMDVIGNNISNVNTTGYKAGRVTFQDQLSQTLQGASTGDGKNVGGTNPLQTGLGVRIASIDTVMQQGGLQSTSSPTDMAIQGNGYFMLGNGNGLSYTRDGSFAVDNSGDLVNASNGSYVLGWAANASGNIDTTKQIDKSSHLSIPVGGLTTTSPSTKITYTGNLDATATPSSAPYTRSVNVYDSLGTKHTITLSFTQSGTANVWNWTASDGSTPPDPNLAGITPSASTPGTITYSPTGSFGSMTGAITLNFAAGYGATTPQVITPDFGATSQVAGASSMSPSGQDGYPPGTLQSFSVDATGVITGIFNNGLTRPLGQIAIAGFANPQGLERSGGNEFTSTNNSGLAQVGTATESGLGKISTGYLEQSNVDLSNEFTNMIVTQRGFQANTKIVSTVDQMLNDVIQMKQ